MSESQGLEEVMPLILYMCWGERELKTRGLFFFLLDTKLV